LARVGQPELGLPLLRRVRLPPLHRRALVAAEVDVRAREDLQHLTQDGPDEVDRRVVDVQDVVADPPDLPDTELGLREVAELRVRRDRGLHVTGQVDLRDHGDPALGGVGDDLAQVVLGVEPAVPLTVVLELGLVVGHLADHRLVPPGADLGEPRVRVDLDPPALVVGEVQVQHVQPVQGDHVDHLEDEVLRHEVPRDVEHHPAPAEPRRVRDPHRRHGDLATLGRYGSVQHLLVRRLGVPQRVLGAGREPGAVRRHVDPVLGLAEVLDHRPDRLGDRILGEPLAFGEGEFARGRNDRDVGHPDSKGIELRQDDPISSIDGRPCSEVLTTRMLRTLANISAPGAFSVRLMRR
jgi:hypothetical protein